MPDFQINDKVIHCREGLSVITGTTVMADRDYFVMHSLRGDGEAVYVPFLTADKIIRKIMSISEADNLLSSLKSISKEFNSNTKQRRDAYKRRLATGLVEDIAYLYRQFTLYEEEPEGVKLGPADIEMLTYAKNCLLDELSLTYESDRDNIEEIVKKKIR